MTVTDKVLYKNPDAQSQNEKLKDNEVKDFKQCAPRVKWMKNCGPCFLLNRFEENKDKQILSCDCKNQSRMEITLLQKIHVDTAPVPNDQLLEVSERIVTVDEMLDDNFTCTPGENFKLECNTCWCHKNGKEPKTCTRISCNPKVYESLA